MTVRLNHPGSSTTLYWRTMDIEASIGALRQALLADERVSAAILFGSAARGQARPSSDLDVGVIARSEADAHELQAGDVELVGRLSTAAGRDVQLVVLDRVEPILGRQAFLTGRTLFDRDPKKTARVLERIVIEYFDGEYHRRMRAEALERRREVRRG